MLRAPVERLNRIVTMAIMMMPIKIASSKNK